MFKIGVIGLGEVAQLMHLPVLKDLSDQYRVTAICDVSPSLVRFVSDKYCIEDTYHDAHRLIEDADVDAVFILSPDQYHREYIETALKCGKHVFVEKPVALCSSDVKELIELKKEYPSQILMVGYMRRFSEGFLKAKDMLQSDNRKIEYLRFRDIICEGPFYIGQTRPVFYPKDVPESVIKESGDRRRTQLERALGLDATDSHRVSFQMLTGLGCHSFSAVRELVGLPKKIKSVATHSGGEHMVIVMEFDGFLGVYELVNNQDIVQFDASIEIFQGSRKIKIKYETPYIRYQPETLEVIESNDRETRTINYGPCYTDAFQTELIEFYNCLKEGRHPKTTLEDSLEDLLCFEEIISVLKREEA